MDERIVISQLYQSHISIRSIAKQLHRNPSTISRELKRNHLKKGINHGEVDYSPASAWSKYEERRNNCGRKTYQDKDTIKCIKEKLEQHCSPEQIFHRLSAHQYIPSTSTIYHMIHSGIITDINMNNLRRKGKFTRPSETRGKFNDRGRTIRKRPKDIYKRAELGHWEGDTVESGR